MQLTLVPYLLNHSYSTILSPLKNETFSLSLRLGSNQATVVPSQKSETVWAEH